MERPIAEYREDIDQWKEDICALFEQDAAPGSPEPPEKPSGSKGP